MQFKKKINVACYLECVEFAQYLFNLKISEKKKMLQNLQKGFESNVRSELAILSIKF
jgi:hypothetical protein